MNSTRRVMVEFFGPSLLASLLLIPVGFLFHPERNEIWKEALAHEFWSVVAGSWGLLFMLVLISFIYTCLPSMFFAAGMEFAFYLGLRVQSWWTILLASSLGGASGFIMILIFGTARHTPPIQSTGTLLFSAFVGGIVGAIIRSCGPPQEKEMTNKTRRDNPCQPSSFDDFT